MSRGPKSVLLSLFLVVCAAALYTLVLHVTTVVTVPSQNRWWVDQWSIPLAFGVSVTVFLMASLSRWLFFVLVNLSVGLAALAGHFIGGESVILDKNLIASVLETTTTESSEFVSIGLLAGVCVAIGLGLALTIPYLKYYKPNFLGFALRTQLAAAILLIIGWSVPDHTLKASANVYIPAAFAFGAYDYYVTQEKMDEQVRNRFDIATLPSSIDPETSENFTVVLVIGELARADHLSLNGYLRDTNPYLKRETGLINFNDVISCDAYSRVAVPCLLTRATLKNKDLRLRETSLLNIAKKHGFQVTWISNNNIYGAKNLPISAIANSSDEKIFRFGADVSYDEATDLYLLPFFQKTVQKHKTGRELIVVHIRGSHYKYNQRYIRNFAVFKPDDCDDIRCIINSYDNSILFTDYVLSQVIENLRSREALLFYVSDHGESLGEVDERGQVYWKHGQTGRIEQRRVPMHVWASNLFIANHPDRFGALTRRATTPISHDHFFHSVLDCIGIRSDAVDERLSLCARGNVTEREEFRDPKVLTTPKMATLGGSALPRQ